MPKLTIAQNILAANDTYAAGIRKLLVPRGIRAINFMSSPGAGKTTLLERSIERLRDRLQVGVIEGDVETSADAERIEAAGAAETVQINTRGNCHLEAHMVQAALNQFDLDRVELLIIENIGNLICPNAWDLGEDLRVVITSTTEGDEKPAKYPQMFADAQVMVINKLDLLPYVDYDIEKVRQQVRSLNPHVRVFELSCRTGDGLDGWCEWLENFAHGEI